MVNFLGGIVWVMQATITYTSIWNLRSMWKLRTETNILQIVEKKKSMDEMASLSLFFIIATGDNGF